MKPGDYVVQFEPIFGYTTPDNQSVVLDRNRSINGVYVVKTHTLTIETNLAGAQARIANKVSWTNLPTNIVLPESNYTIDFSELSSYKTPVSQTITLDKNMTITGTYAADIPIGKEYNFGSSGN